MCVCAHAPRQYDNLQKAAFLRELARSWEHFDARVLRYKVLPPLLSELRNAAVQALALPLVLAIASRQDPKDFVEVRRGHSAARRCT